MVIDCAIGYADGGMGGDPVDDSGKYCVLTAIVPRDDSVRIELCTGMAHTVAISILATGISSTISILLSLPCSSSVYALLSIGYQAFLNPGIKLQAANKIKKHAAKMTPNKIFVKV